MVMEINSLEIQTCKKTFSMVFCLFNQLNFVLGDPNGWRLSRIEEVDHETPV